MDKTQIEELWFDGFAKAAEAAGVTDKNQIAQLCKLAERRAIRARNPQAFDEGVKTVEKQALSGKALLGGIGATGLLGAGMLAGSGAKENWLDMKEGLGEEAFQTRLMHANRLRGLQRARRAAMGSMGGGDMYGGMYGRAPFGYGG